MVSLMTEWTNQSWRHVRIDRVAGRGRFAVRTWFLATSFGPMAKACLGVPADVNLERLSLKDAREWGEKIERRLGAAARLRRGVESEIELNARKDALL